MSNRANTPAADGADRHQQVLDAVRDRGPDGLWEVIGDHAHLLTAIARSPGRMFETGEHASGSYVQLLRTLHEARSAIDALEARAVVALSGATRREQIAAARDEAAQEDGEVVLARIEKQADLLARTELTLAARRSPHAAGAALTRSRRIVADMPHLLDALACGTVRAEVVYDTARTLGPLEPVDRRAVDRMLGQQLPDLDGAGTARWKHAVTTAIGRIDPERAARGHQRAVRDRYVTVTTQDHAMATLHARLPAREAMLVRKRLSLEAEGLRAQGDRRGHHAIMADALVDTLLGRHPGQMEPVTLDVGVIITDRALLDPGSTDIAHLEGYGPVPADSIRADLADTLRTPQEPGDEPVDPDGHALRAVLRRLYTHPTTGELVAVESRAREFPAAMARFLRWRDVICRGPHCNAVIRQSDHILAAARGGPTSLANGQGLCAFCNQKELQARSVTRTEGPGHQVRWTSHTGQTRTTRPTPLTPPVPPGDPGAYPAGPPGDPGADPPVAPDIPATPESQAEPDAPAEPGPPAGPGHDPPANPPDDHR